MFDVKNGQILLSVFCRVIQLLNHFLFGAGKGFTFKQEAN